MIGVTLAALALVGYIGSYWALSHRGRIEAAEEHRPFFYYVSSDSYQSDDGYKVHCELAAVYAPLNLIDRYFLSGLPPVQGGIRRLSATCPGGDTGDSK